MENQLLKDGRMRFPQLSLALTRQGFVLGYLGPEDRLCLSLEQIGETVVSAFLAAEDKRFFTHRGIDLLAILRATGRNLLSVRVVQGGSTITQQVVRNFFLRDRRRTFWRKAKEAWGALRLERRLSKNQILEAYLNGIWFGHGTWGIRLAALRAFGKEPSQLDDREACYLAGLPKGPARYCRCCNPGRAEERTQQVLRLRAPQGEPGARPVQNAGNRGPRHPSLSGIFPRTVGYFLKFASTELLARVPERFPHDQLIVTTTLWQTCQEAVEQACRELSVVDPQSTRRLACIVQDAGTGDVRGYSGGRDHRMTPFDAARSGRVQAGSVLKPFVLAAAISAGVKAHTVYESKPLTIPLGRGRVWHVRNHLDRYAGKIDLAQALALSDNSVFAQLILDISAERVSRLLNAVGLEVDETVPAIALGAVRRGVSPLQVSDAYSIFSSRGYRRRHRVLVSAKTSDGSELLAEPVSWAESRIIPLEVCEEVRWAMRLAARMGTGKIDAAGADLYAKTGTTPTGAWYASFDESFRVLTWVEESSEAQASPLPGKARSAKALAERIWQLLRRPELRAPDLLGAFRGADALNYRDMVALENEFQGNA